MSACKPAFLSAFASAVDSCGGSPPGDVPANAITLDDGTPITLDDGTTYVTTDS